ncbi:tyrosyl-DNA phosphodiesterase-domain-containing protein [Scleroderma citrinum]
MDHDEDLARAIALSLMDHPGHQSSSNAQGQHSRDDDDELQFQQDLHRAIEASKSDSHTPAQLAQSVTQATVELNSSSMPSASQSRTSTPSGSFLSERAQLEKERLARLKRQHNEDHEDEPSSQTSLPNKRQYSSTSLAERASIAASASSISSLNLNSSSPEEMSKANAPNAKIPVVDQLFWDGELRPTANLHSQPRQDAKPTFRLSEVLGPNSQISFAIISSFATSVSWIYEFFDPRTPVIIVAQPGESGNAEIKNILPNWVMTVPFLRNGMGCQHMKFMLIFYKTGRLRVVISTANLITYDWRDIENAVWLQDIPPRNAPIPHDPKVLDDFPSIMQNVLRAVNVRPALANMLANDHPNLPLQIINDLRSKWDWSNVKVKLIPSISGKHEGWPAVVQSGHTRLMKAIRELGLRTGGGKAARDLTIECQGSSIGTYSTQWLNEFHYSARGESAEDWLDQPKARRAKLPWPHVKVLFPSLRTVQQTVLREPGGGSMFCRTHQWEGAKFPRELFHDSNSTGGRVLMHTKMIIATFHQKQPLFLASSPAKASATPSSSSEGKGKGKEVITISDSETESDTDDERAGGSAAPSSSSKEPLGWAYVGSHNFTPSAWGTLSGSGFNPVLNNVNYELGILFPLYSQKEVEKVSCFKRPPRKYVLGEDRPWIQGESAVFRENGR